MIFTQQEKRYLISNDKESGVRGDVVELVDDASLRMCSSLNYLHLEQRQKLTLEVKTKRNGNGATRRPLTGLPHPKRETNCFTLCLQT
jgi:hypothetical protein